MFFDLLLLLLLLLASSPPAAAAEYVAATAGPSGVTDKRPSCDCEDDVDWTNGGRTGANGWAGCESYAKGFPNEGRCDADGASVFCPRTCDACPGCAQSSASATMLWIGMPCALCFVCVPLLKNLVARGLAAKRKKGVGVEQKAETSVAPGEP